MVIIQSLNKPVVVILELALTITILIDILLKLINEGSVIKLQKKLGIYLSRMELGGHISIDNNITLYKPVHIL